MREHPPYKPPHEKGHVTEDELNAKIAEILTRDTLVGVSLPKVSR